jgi:hypothetical protein
MSREFLAFDASFTAFDDRLLLELLLHVVVCKHDDLINGIYRLFGRNLKLLFRVLYVVRWRNYFSL